MVLDPKCLLVGRGYACSREADRELDCRGERGAEQHDPSPLAAPGKANTASGCREVLAESLKCGERLVCAVFEASCRPVAFRLAAPGLVVAQARDSRERHATRQSSPHVPRCLSRPVNEGDSHSRRAIRGKLQGPGEPPAAVAELDLVRTSLLAGFHRRTHTGTACSVPRDVR